MLVLLTLFQCSVTWGVQEGIDWQDGRGAAADHRGFSLGLAGRPPWSKDPSSSYFFFHPEDNLPDNLLFKTAAVT